MKSLFKPIEFVSPLALPVARISLRELCGSALYGNYPFRDDSEVDDTSFKLVEDYRERRAFPLKQLDIIGSLSEENNVTRVRVTAQNHKGNKTLDIIFTCLLVIAAIIFSVMADPPSIFALIFVAIFYCAIWPLFYLMAYLRFKRLLRKIKNALGVE
jgi:hypothetical protein